MGSLRFWNASQAFENAKSEASVGFSRLSLRLQPACAQGDTSPEGVDCGLLQKQKAPADQKHLHWKQNACVGIQLLKLARNMTNYSELCSAEASSHGLAKDHVHWTSEKKIQSFHHHVP